MPCQQPPHIHAGNRCRLIAKHAEGSTDQAVISELIRQSKDARDCALTRHDITNERTAISSATFKCSPQDHRSVAAHVRVKQQKEMVGYEGIVLLRSIAVIRCLDALTFTSASPLKLACRLPRLCTGSTGVTPLPYSCEQWEQPEHPAAGFQAGPSMNKPKCEMQP
jgi:hypothetical protein